MTGEMYISFYQLQAGANHPSYSSSSDSEDEHDRFLSLSLIARTTKNMAETTFGMSTSVDHELCVGGGIIYYGDGHVVIDVVDSNRTRSKFNRILTHYRKQDEIAVRGGYLRCDGRGKPILFELHGGKLPSVQAIDVSTPPVLTKKEEDEDILMGQPSLCISASGENVAIGRAMELQDVTASSVIAVSFSDGGIVKIHCSQFIEAHEEPFYLLVKGGKRPLRIQVQAVRNQTIPAHRLYIDPSARWHDRKLLVMILMGVMVIGSSMFFSLYGLIGFLVSSLVYKVTTESTRADDTDTMGFPDGWKFVINSIEASNAERIETVSPFKSQYASGSSTSLDKSCRTCVPPSFLVAENGNVIKATERYQATTLWRQEMDIDNILSSPQRHYSVIKQ